MHRIQGAGKVLLPLEPEAGQACVVSGQQDAAQRGLIVLCIDHRLSDLNAQLELQVAQHLLDGALDLLSGDLRAGEKAMLFLPSPRFAPR